MVNEKTVKLICYRFSTFSGEGYCYQTLEAIEMAQQYKIVSKPCVGCITARRVINKKDINTLFEVGASFEMFSTTHNLQHFKELLTEKYKHDILKLQEQIDVKKAKLVQIQAIS